MFLEIIIVDVQLGCMKWMEVHVQNVWIHALNVNLVQLVTYVRKGIHFRVISVQSYATRRIVRLAMENWKRIARIVQMGRFLLGVNVKVMRKQ